MLPFSADARLFSKKNQIYFLPIKTKKNQASKVAHNQPQTFFPQHCPAAQTSPELIFHIINIKCVPRLICLLICD